ncbi:MAG: cupin domain-containing protein [Patescibacteria group bacterium]
MTPFHIIDPHSLPWQRRADGVYTKELAHNEEQNQYLTLFKIEKGAALKKHQHPCTEWMYVLEGEYKDDFGTAKTGQLKINEPHSIHTGAAGDGCLLLVLWCGRHEDVI